MSDFRKLSVWQKAHDLMLATHKLVDGIRGHDFGSLRGQMYRAAESIPANIVESRSHDSGREAARFLRIALNSATELEYHVLAARDLGTIRPDVYDRFITRIIEVRKMLYGLIRYMSGRKKA